MSTPDKITLDSSISIGMSAYGNYDTTREALAALFASATGDYELILVDDCSPDNTRSLFIEAGTVHKNTSVYGFDINKEYSGSLNAILSQASGDAVIFISNDILVTPSYLRRLINVAHDNNAHGIVRGCSNFVDNGLATHNRALPAGIDNWFQLAEFSQELESRYGDSFIIDSFLTGDAFLVTRNVIEKIGTLDPSFYGYFSDHDFGIRARIAGFKLVLSQGAYSLHKHTSNFDYLEPDLRQIKVNSRLSKIFENWARFKIKYGLPVEQAYQDIRKIDWDTLCKEDFDINKHYNPPINYSEYLL